MNGCDWCGRDGRVERNAILNQIIPHLNDGIDQEKYAEQVEVQVKCLRIFYSAAYYPKPNDHDDGYKCKNKKIRTDGPQPKSLHDPV